MSLTRQSVEVVEGGELDLDSVVLFVVDLDRSRRFYEGVLGLQVVLDDDIVVVLQMGTGRLVLHRNDRGHDARGIWPAGDVAGATALRFAVHDPDVWHARLEGSGAPIVWPVQDAVWGRFVLTADPDGRPIALARMAVSRSARVP
jgi:catechol 2,3-dioxygenase-like lactoylglutathione lyase family enzyme